MRLSRRTLTLVTIGAVPLLAGGWIVQSRSSRAGAQLLGQVMDLVANRFVDTVDAPNLYEKAARGLVKELNDPYSELFTPKQIADFSRTTNGRYGGIGMEITPLPGGGVAVARVFPNTPAENAGIQEGDRIVQVDTSNTRTWTSQQVSNALLGTPGTKVKASFQRAGVAAPITANFTRAEIKIPAVPFAITFDGTVGYVPVQRFSENTAEEINAAVKNLEARGAKSVILDLRDNPGGILDEAIATSNLFLKRGQNVLSVRGRGGESMEYTATAQPLAPTIPMVVLVNQYSASASEIVAGALQDHDRAVVLGQTSYGKGLVQSVFPLDGGYALKMTTAKWYTPSGRSIQKERKMIDGQYVEVHPDSLESDSARKARPTYKSDAGRIVYGGGAVTPDVVVRADTLTTPEQTLARALSTKFGVLFTAMRDIAVDQKGKVQPNFTLQPQWRDELYNRLVKDSVKIDRATWDAGRAYVDRQLELQIAHVAFGDSTQARHALKDDTQLQRAIELLKKGTTQKDLFAVAQATARSTP
jgi:carboxyl-terminal processing protease